MIPVETVFNYDWSLGYEEMEMWVLSKWWFVFIRTDQSVKFTNSSFLKLMLRKFVYYFHVLILTRERYETNDSFEGIHFLFLLGWISNLRVHLGEAMLSVKEIWHPDCWAQGPAIHMAISINGQNGITSCNCIIWEIVIITCIFVNKWQIWIIWFQGKSLPFQDNISILVLFRCS